MSAVVVADASPLIAFQQIGQLQLLRTMFGELTVPPAVAREILPSVPFAPWIVVRRLTQPIAPLVVRADLGAGESEALSLAVEIRADLLFVDERAGRRVAAALGLSVVGTLGVILAAKRTGHIGSPASTGWPCGTRRSGMLATRSGRFTRGTSASGGCSRPGTSPSPGTNWRAWGGFGTRRPPVERQSPGLRRPDRPARTVTWTRSKQ